MVIFAPVDLENKQEELQKSFHERSYVFHHQIDNPGRIWRNLYAESEEILVALTPHISISLNNQLLQLNPFEEFNIPKGHCFDIIGRCPVQCEWIYAYDPAEVSLQSRIQRKSGPLSRDDYEFLIRK